MGVIQQLYIGKFQCPTCGLRFTSKQKTAYAQHFDWHFWENQQASAAAARYQSSRDWYPSLQEWTVYEENLEEQIRNHRLLSKQNRQGKDNDLKQFSASAVTDETSCPAKSNGDADDDVSGARFFASLASQLFPFQRCFVCHDPFETYFDDNRDEWRLKDAIRINGKTYHPICYQDAQNPVETGVFSRFFVTLLLCLGESRQRSVVIGNAIDQTDGRVIATKQCDFRRFANGGNGHGNRENQIGNGRFER